MPSSRKRKKSPSISPKSLSPRELSELFKELPKSDREDIIKRAAIIMKLKKLPVNKKTIDPIISHYVNAKGKQKEKAKNKLIFRYI